MSSKPGEGWVGPQALQHRLCRAVHAAARPGATRQGGVGVALDVGQGGGAGRGGQRAQRLAVRGDQQRVAHCHVHDQPQTHPPLVGAEALDWPDRHLLAAGVDPLDEYGAGRPPDPVAAGSVELMGPAGEVSDGPAPGGDNEHGPKAEGLARQHLGRRGEARDEAGQRQLPGDAVGAHLALGDGEPLDNGVLDGGAGAGGDLRGH